MISPDTLIPGAGDPQNLNRYMYARGNPVRYKDPTGHWIETALDIAFIGYDLWDISQNGLNWENGLSLAADVAGAILPVVTGGGMAVRAAMHADDGLKALNAVDNVIDAANAIDNAADAANSADNVVDALNAVCSFSGDTLIATSDGERPIQDIEPGDKVLAFDESTGSVNYFAVTHTWSHDDEAIEYLTVAGETLVTTPEHPFMTKELGWLPAGNLWVGAHVLTADGTYEAVNNVLIRVQHRVMYNLTVDQAHTYFVGESQSLVHNACPLDRALGGTPGDGLSAHHVIPDAFSDHRIVQFAEPAGWQHQGAMNGMLLPSNQTLANAMELPVHNGYNTPHRELNQAMGNILDSMWDEAMSSGWTASQAKMALFRLAQDAKYTIWETGQLLVR